MDRILMGNGRRADGGAMGRGRVVLVWARADKSEPIAVGLVVSMRGNKGGRSVVNVVAFSVRPGAGTLGEGVNQCGWPTEAMAYFNLRNVAEDVGEGDENTNRMFGWSWPGQEAGT